MTIDGCFKDLLCISGSLLVNPLSKSTICAFMKKQAVFLVFCLFSLFFFWGGGFQFVQSSNYEGIVFWMHLWNCWSQRVLMHVRFNLQIVLHGHMGIMQCKLLNTIQTGEFSRPSMWEGLSECLLWGDFMLNGFMLLISNLHWLSLAASPWSWPKLWDVK